MTREESIEWLECLKTIIGQHQYRNLLNYEQPLAEIIELLQSNKLVELPCEIGTELFLIDYPTVRHRLKRYEITGTRVVMVIECFESQSICKRLVDVHFGKTVFLTKEEAEAKLKELESDK